MTATLTLGTTTLPTAPVGPLNPLPAVASMPQAPYRASTTGLPDDIAANLRYGQVTSIHPYLLQDGYERSRHPAPLRVAVLENDQLRAEFALDLGGRLVRLFDRSAGRDLVYRNAVLQPANLALRNAWFSGGVEWNIGMRGHWPLTCEPLYAAALTAADGEPVLRMWEYERKRGLIVQLDATLGSRSPALHVRVRVRNPHESETGMYWWTNIAIAQHAGSRVFAPATHAYRTGYDGALRRADLSAEDASRPASAPAAADHFFDLPDEGMPWIAALDGDGAGLAHVSTPPLTGRKLFVWGDTTGGRHWCEWLGGATGSYFEIQAGFTTTQYEHLPMPGGATWEWHETFLPLRVDDPQRNAEWADATAAVGAAVRSAVGDAGGTDAGRLAAVQDAAPERMLSTGSAWGALEAELARRYGAAFASLPGVRFERDAGRGNEYWAALLDRREPTDAGDAAPASYVEGERWDRLLAEVPATWLTHYHRGVMAHASGSLERAVAHYRASLRQRRTAWALRGLGLALTAQGDADQGIAALVDAHAIAPECAPLARELGEALLAEGRAEDTLAFLASLPADMRRLGRFRLLDLRASLSAGDRARAQRLLEEGVEVPDIREGELSMSELWRQAFPERAVPARYDFTMK
ncbi:DUF5107 domain-containing protein [Microbacterium sp.]|uniref:DUF5107 domain-containing protein n=1 Tax=Microbacterium sp. TaxID=51671 RepID=UPI00281110BC|nr:DUF5107 domain-containing protein [Microbacterium sp.]